MSNWEEIHRAKNYWTKGLDAQRSFYANSTGAIASLEDIECSLGHCGSYTASEPILVMSLSAPMR